MVAPGFRFVNLPMNQRITTLSCYCTHTERLIVGQTADSLRDSSNASNALRQIDCFRGAIRSRHYSLRAERTHWFWIRYCIKWHNSSARQTARLPEKSD
jgi:hypothetical protein